jgi:sRNA-binding carbon storage regulator CsrA
MKTENTSQSSPDPLGRTHLVLSLKTGQGFKLNDLVELEFLEYRRGWLKVSIKAPREVEILRHNAKKKFKKSR